MFYPSPQANDIIIYDVNQNPIIAAYVSDAQIILPYIRPQDTYNQVIRYWAALDRPFSATDRSIRQELAIHQFILTQSEESKDNTTRVVRLAGNVEHRFLVFDIKRLEGRYGKITL